MDNNRESYFLAIRAGLEYDKPMQELFRQVLRDSVKGAGE